MDQGHLRFPASNIKHTKSSSKCAQSENSTNVRHREKRTLSSPMLPPTEVDLKNDDQRCIREESEDGGLCGGGWLCRRFCPLRAGCVHIISGRTFKKRVAHLFTRPAFPHCRVYYIRSFID